MSEGTVKPARALALEPEGGDPAQPSAPGALPSYALELTPLDGLGISGGIDVGEEGEFGDSGDTAGLQLADDEDGGAGARWVRQGQQQPGVSGCMRGRDNGGDEGGASGHSGEADCEGGAGGGDSGDSGDSGGCRAAVLDTAALSADVSAVLAQMSDDCTAVRDELDEQELVADSGGGAAPSTDTTAASAAVDIGSPRANTPPPGGEEEEEEEAAVQRVLSLVASAAERMASLAAGALAPCQRLTAAARPEESRGQWGVVAVAAAAAAAGGGTADGGTVSTREVDAELLEALRLVRWLSRAGAGGPLQGGDCAAALMRLGASPAASDAGRAAAFDAVSELCATATAAAAAARRRQRGADEPGARDGAAGGGVGSARAAAEAAAAVPGGPQALVECLARWSTNPSPAAAPLTAAALRAAVSLSASAAPLMALLRARMPGTLAAALARGVAAAPLQRSMAGFLAGLSAHAVLSRPLMSAGVHLVACRLLAARNRSLAVRQYCCDIISNLALGATAPSPSPVIPGAGEGQREGGLGDRAAQAALVAAGAGPGLARVLSLRNVEALCHAADAIANLSLGAYVPAQNALSGAVAPLAGLLVTAVGPGGQPRVLAVKVARALGNVCQGHGPNQDTAVKAGVMPVLTAWMSSRVGPLVRSAAATAANVVLGNADAVAAAVTSGLLQPLLLTIVQPLAPPSSSAMPSASNPAPSPAPSPATSGVTAGAAPSPTMPEPGPQLEAGHEPGSGSKSGLGSQSPEDSGTSHTRTTPPHPAPPSMLPYDVFERCCALLCCMTAASAELRGSLLRQSGLGRLMVARLAGSPPPGVAMAVCGVLNNLVGSSCPASQGEVVRLGAVPPLQRLVYSQHEGVLRRACHCLATLTMGHKALQDALLGPYTTPPPLPSPRAAATAATAAAGPDLTPAAVSTNGCTCNGNSSSTNAEAGGDGELDVTAAAATDVSSTDGQGSAVPGPLDSRGLQPLPARLAEMLRAAAPPAAASSSGSGGGGGGGGGPKVPPRVSPVVAAELARLCGALCFRANSFAQQRLAEAGVLEALVALLNLNHVPAVGQALMALANLAGGCHANRQRLMAAGLATELHRLLRVRGDEVVARAAYCAAVLADPGGEVEPSAAVAAAAVPNGNSAVTAATSAVEPGSSRTDGGRVKSSRKGTGGPAPAEAVVAAAAAAATAPAAQEDLRTALAAAGLVPPLVRVLRHSNPDVAARGVAALEALVRGHRANARLVVAAGGIAQLAALMERTGTAAAAVAAEAAAPSASSSLLAPTGLAGPTAGAVVAAASQAPLRASDAQLAVLWRRCVDLWAALGGTAALVRLLNHKEPAVVERAATLIRAVVEGGDVEEKSRLRRAGFAPPLLRACRHRLVMVVEAALLAVEALAGCCDGSYSGDVAPGGLPPDGPVNPTTTSATATSTIMTATTTTTTTTISNGNSKSGRGARTGSSSSNNDNNNSFRAQLVDAGALGVLQGLQGHKRAAIARLASRVSQCLYVKPPVGGTAARRTAGR